MSVRRGGSGRLRRVAVLLAGSLVACLLPAASRDMVLPGFASLARAELGQPRQQDEKPRALKDFLARPDFHAAVVSPQGRHLAVAARSGLYLLDLGH
jgi:hypothetical protein